MLHLVTFGGLALESANEAIAPRLSAQRLALLAVLAAEGGRHVSRERMTGLFWPDVDEERARHSLRQAMYTLRHEVGREIIRSDFALSLDPSAITADVVEFRAALACGDRVAAATLVRGPFLAGFYSAVGRGRARATAHRRERRDSIPRRRRLGRERYRCRCRMVAAAHSARPAERQVRGGLPHGAGGAR